MTERTRDILPQEIIRPAERGTLTERVKARHEIEPGETASYGNDKWLRIYAAIDLGAVYREWRAELQRRGIEYVKVDGGGRR